jgi:DNA-binding MurR/RpiR family transcriptional regulator
MSIPKFDVNHPRAEGVDSPPRDFAALKALIGGQRSRLPKRLLQAADFTLANPQEVAFGRVTEVASLAGVQPSTLVRFAQALGYSGFSDMQAVFLAHARQRWPDYRERLDFLEGEGADANAPLSLLRGFTRASNLSLQRLEHSINPAALDGAVALLAGAASIYVLATRRSFPAAAYLAYALRRLQIRCEMVDHAGGLAAEQLALAGDGDALVAISFTPYAPVTLDLATATHQRGVPVLAITDSAFSPLVQAATLWLEVAEADHAAFRSLAGTFALAATLAVAVATQRRQSVE